MSSKKTDFRDRPVPDSLGGLPRFGFTPSRAVTRDQSARRDVAFGVRSIDDLMEQVGRGFSDPETLTSPSKPTKKKK
jgi:hypothetical protein